MRALISIALAATVAAVAVAGPVRPAEAAAVQGTGAWYWPTGSEDFGMSSWWDARPGCWHLAQDMKASVGSPVYAIGAGTVLESKNVAGYGPGGGTGGAVVILHRTASGREFKALYGHLKELKYGKGDKVAAGAVIGKVNSSSPPHVHFGIHPGRNYPSDNNPFRGHTYTSRNTYGWVNPVKFLRENPRVIPYRAPALPVVMSRATTVTPTAASASGGYVYWRQESAEATSAWRYAIASKSLVRIPYESRFPASDTRRYLVKVTSSPPAISVTDKMPGVTLAASDATPRYKAPTRFSGVVRNAAGKVFQGAPVVLERWSGTSWAPIARGITDTSGRFSLSFRPKHKSKMRVRFAPPSTYVTGVSRDVTVLPHVSVSTPVRSVTSPAKGAKFTVSSYVLPKHSSSAKVEFQLQRYEGGKWVSKAVLPAKVASAGDRNLCTAAARCDLRGSWKVRTLVHEDGGHAATVSKWMSFTVK